MTLEQRYDAREELHLQQFTLPPARRIPALPAPSTRVENPLLMPGQPSLIDRQIMLGIGFGAQGVPIDVLALLLSARGAGAIHVLITDSFASMNGVDDGAVRSGALRLEKVLNKAGDLYHLPLNIRRCSDFMSSGEYMKCYQSILSLVTSLGIQEQILEIVPERLRTTPSALAYPNHEIAVTLYMMRHHGISLKLGPSREKLYDSIMSRMSLPVEFRYTVDALPLGTSRVSPVVHYVPGHREKGSRVMFGETEKFAQLLKNTDRSCLEYLLEIACEAGRARGASLPRLDRHCPPDTARMKDLVLDLFSEHVMTHF